MAMCMSALFSTVTSDPPQFTHSPFLTMVRKLFLMRHAITASNINSLWTGHLDINIATSIQHPRIMPPTSTGQASVDVIICSTAKRCRQTLDLIDNATNTKVVYDSQFIECCYGKYTGLPKDSDIFRRTLYNTPGSSGDFIGESRLVGGRRAFKRYQQLVTEQQLHDKAVLIVSHKNTLTGFWVLYYLDQYYKSIGSCLDLERIGDVSVQHMDEIIARHPIPSPFVNTQPYELQC